MAFRVTSLLDCSGCKTVVASSREQRCLQANNLQAKGTWIFEESVLLIC